MEIEEIKKCTTFSEVGKILGYNYYNGRIKVQIIKYCNSYGIDIEKQILEYNNRKVYCLCCGKEITGKDRFLKKYCSKSCSAKVRNTGRKRTDSEKKKISESLKKRVISDGKIRIFDNNKNIVTDTNYIKSRLMYENTCCICGKKFLTPKKTITHCSKQCVSNDQELNERLRQKQLELVKSGKHHGWNSRNILSYPEKFWIKVLDNNNIKYITNKPFKGYFLDFYIENNNRIIDLEIDGKQHKHLDRKISDEKRDNIVRESGIEVYRIDWNEINTEKGNEMMKNKINNFITFYNNK